MDKAGTGDLLGIGFEGLEPYVRKSKDLRQTLVRLGKIGDKATNRAARKLHHQLKHAEPSVTMIGQVKAGKTSLVNAMVGLPDLLPADVNPWTSVVTSLHLSPYTTGEENKARFKFFDMEEWGRLLDRGGRIGELAERAGAEDELEKVRQQVVEMREKSRARLGEKFEMLLGQQHDYNYLDGDLIERYVCLGDDFEDDTETSQSQGRFADITKSAELFVARPDLPTPLCIRDTPGVNDTFMIREQITIRAIRESRICVVVLAAHQALSSVDLALIRMISNVKSREVIIVVNRVDELSDPVSQIPEIRDSIRRTLADHDGPKEAEILFTSAFCANAALSGRIDALDQASLANMCDWARGEGHLPEALGGDDELLWHLSGVPQVYRALSDRIAEGMGRELLERVAKSAMNLASGLSAQQQVVSRRDTDAALPPLELGQLDQALATLEAEAEAMMNDAFDRAEEDFNKRLERSHRSFLERATGSLLQHLDANGEGKVWEYDPTGLRILMRTAYQVFGRNAQSGTKKVLLKAAEDYAALYHRLFDLGDEDGFGIEAPSAPRIPSPVLLGQTIALDLKGTWWSRWWHKRRGYRNFATEFAEIIKAETDPIVDALRGPHAKSIRDASMQALGEFLAEQRAIISRVAERAGEDGSVGAMLDESGAAQKRAQLKQAIESLSGFAA
ncbi:MAG: dynamin family protein [Silicimonas sp.]|nr:dynamin family protein [Silicimonas sp.]